MVVETRRRKALCRSARVFCFSLPFLCVHPRTFKILNSQFFFLCITWGTQYESVHLTDFVMYTVKSTGHDTVPRAKFFLICVCFVPVVGRFTAPSLAGLVPKVRLHFASSTGLLWLGLLSTESEAQNLRLKKNSRKLRLFFFFLIL